MLFLYHEKRDGLSRTYPYTSKDIYLRLSLQAGECDNHSNSV